MSHQNWFHPRWRYMIAKHDKNDIRSPFQASGLRYEVKNGINLGHFVIQDHRKRNDREKSEQNLISRNGTILMGNLWGTCYRRKKKSNYVRLGKIWDLVASLSDGVKLSNRLSYLESNISPWARRKKHWMNSHLIIHCPTSEGVSEVSERANKWAQRRARAKRAVRSKWTSERCERTSERTSEWPSTTVCIFGCYRPQCGAEWLWAASADIARACVWLEAKLKVRLLRGWNNFNHRPIS